MQTTTFSSTPRGAGPRGLAEVQRYRDPPPDHPSSGWSRTRRGRAALDRVVFTDRGPRAAAPDPITGDVTAAGQQDCRAWPPTVQVDRMDERCSSARKHRAAARRGQEKRDPFAQPTSMDQGVRYCQRARAGSASLGDGELAASDGAPGQKVGRLDADIYGHSVARMLGGQRPYPPTNRAEDIMPRPRTVVKVISIGPVHPRQRARCWRGRCCTARCSSFLADVFCLGRPRREACGRPRDGDVDISVASSTGGRTDRGHHTTSSTHRL